MDANEKTFLLKKKELAIKTALDLQKIIPKDDFDLVKEADYILEFIDNQDKNNSIKEGWIKLAERILHNNCNNEDCIVANQIISTLELLEKKINPSYIPIDRGSNFTRTSLIERLNTLY